MTFNLVTAFPQFYDSFLSTSLIKKAVDKKLLNFNFVDLKDFGIGKFKKIDDTPYGGGPGMVIRVDIVEKALESITNKGHVILLSPTGKTFNQEKASKLKTHDTITLICGRYEGFDFRVNSLVDEIISIGDFVTMGGGTPSLVIIESVVRLKNGVIGDINSTIEESHPKKYISEPPVYTRPKSYNGMEVPKVLLRGNHKEIEEWKKINGVENKSQ